MKYFTDNDNEFDESFRQFKTPILPPNGCYLKYELLCFETDCITQALEYAKGNIKAAADLLGMGRTTLVEKIKAHRMEQVVADCRRKAA